MSTCLLFLSSLPFWRTFTFCYVTYQHNPGVQIQTILEHSGRTSGQSRSVYTYIDLPRNHKSASRSRLAWFPWDHSYTLQTKTEDWTDTLYLPMLRWGGHPNPFLRVVLVLYRFLSHSRKQSPTNKLNYPRYREKLEGLLTFFFI